MAATHFGRDIIVAGDRAHSVDFVRGDAHPHPGPADQNAAIDLWLASITVMLFSGLLVFDTWRLRNIYGPDEYVGAAVQIYLDLLNIFMAILRVMGNRRN